MSYDDFISLVQVGAEVGREASERAARLQRVADRARDPARARARGGDAVLETLAERIAGGEVDDVIVRLPIALHEPLKRGKEMSGGKARRMSLVTVQLPDEYVAAFGR